MRKDSPACLLGGLLPGPLGALPPHSPQSGACRCYARILANFSATARPAHQDDGPEGGHGPVAHPPQAPRLADGVVQQRWQDQRQRDAAQRAHNHRDLVQVHLVAADETISHPCRSWWAANVSKGSALVVRICPVTCQVIQTEFAPCLLCTWCRCLTQQHVRRPWTINRSGLAGSPPA